MRASFRPRPGAGDAAFVTDPVYSERASRRADSRTIAQLLKEEAGVLHV
jgi:hypothetical protein